MVIMFGADSVLRHPFIAWLPGKPVKNWPAKLKSLANPTFPGTPWIENVFSKEMQPVPWPVIGLRMGMKQPVMPRDRHRGGVVALRLLAGEHAPMVMAPSMVRHEFIDLAKFVKDFLAAIAAIQS